MSILTPVYFTVTDDHVKLLRRMNVGWQYYEYGAPEIDPKRPYGNSAVARDIAEILSWGWPDENTDGYQFDNACAEVENCAWEIHREMEDVVQIALQHGPSPGRYQRDRFGRQWKRVENP